LPGHELPNAHAIVNPNQPGCEFPGKSLAGVGVIFYVLSQVRSVLDGRGWFDRNRIEKPNMANYLDLVALGTVADVVSLDDQNRLLVHQGLQRIRAGRVRPGIRALFEIAKRRCESAVASDIAFGVAPRINAAGRLDDMSLGIRCLLAEDYEQAQELAAELNDLNQDRRAIEASMQQEALKSLAELKNLDEKEQPWGMCLFNDQWHQGVIGILASRIKDQFHRPVIAFAASDNADEIKGSARSIPGIHIRDVLDAVATANPGLIEKFGGHAMAAGLSIQRQRFTDFSAAFDAEIRRIAQQEDFTAELHSDGQLRSDEFSLEIAHELRDAGPWGQNFPEPTFDGEFLMLTQRLVGEKHLKMTLAPIDSPQTVIDAIAFNINLQQWPNVNAKIVRCAYQLDVNEFRGKESVQIRIDFMELIE
jgi:single-stranded-DNA-specific exonuclease